MPIKGLNQINKQGFEHEVNMYEASAMILKDYKRRMRAARSQIFGIAITSFVIGLVLGLLGF